MAFDTTNGTKLAQLVNPQVMADMIDKKLTDEIKFAPLATIDYTLQGQPGNTITLPSFGYIGDAADVAEGVDVSIAKMSTSTATATIKKVGKGVELTDEALLSGYGDPMGEAARQLRHSVAAKVDNDMLAEVNNATLTYTASGTEFTADDIADALVKFGEDIDGEKVIIVSPATYAALRKTTAWIPSTEIGAQMIINGAVGMIHGCQVVLSNKLTGSTYGKKAFIVKPGALRIFMKRDTNVEADRDIVGKFFVITADKHYVCYLYDQSKAIALTHA